MINFAQDEELGSVGIEKDWDAVSLKEIMLDSSCRKENSTVVVWTVKS